MQVFVFFKPDGNISENAHLRHVSVLRKRTEPIHSVVVTFSSCFLNGNVVSCFLYIYVVRFPLLSVSVAFLSTDLRKT